MGGVYVTYVANVDKRQRHVVKPTGSFKCHCSCLYDFVQVLLETCSQPPFTHVLSAIYARMVIKTHGKQS